MALSKEEQAQLDALQKKAEEPEPNVNRSRVDNISVTIDLGDPEQVKRGLKLGLLERGDLDEFDEKEEQEETEEEEAPRRKSRYD